MPQDLEPLLALLARAIAGQPCVRAIGLAGGGRTLPQPGEGDLDVFVYCSAIPPAAERSIALETLGEMAAGVKAGEVAGGHWGVADTLWLAGVETWLMHFTVAEAEHELAETMAGRRSAREDDYYPVGRLAMYRTLRPLYDPDGLLASFRARLGVYPDALRQVELARHLGALADTEDLERGPKRGDVLFFHWALDLALDHFLQALFALNRIYFPSRKRSLEHMRGFALQPKDTAERLLAIVRWGAEAATMQRALDEWMALMQELMDLCAIVRATGDGPTTGPT